MKKSKLRQLIKEVLTKKKSCSCGCNTCENVDNPGVVLNENLSFDYQEDKILIKFYIGE